MVLAEKLRTEILKKRRSLDSHEHKRLSEKIIQRFLKSFSELDLKINFIAFYRAMPDEINISIIKELFTKNLVKDKIRYFYPKITSLTEKNLELFEINPMTTKWLKGPYGIEEPESDSLLTNPNQIDLIFVPGIVFGPYGERLGFGAGFYDRLLKKMIRSIRVSLAFGFQYCENVPQNEWDQKIDWLITEDQEVKFPHAQKKWDLFK